MWIVIQPWSRLLQPFKRRINKSLWVCIENACSEISKKSFSSHICFYAGQPEGAGSFLCGPAEDAPGDKDTQHGTNGAISNPSFSSFASKVLKNAKELWKQRQPGMGVSSRALSSLLWARVGPHWWEFQRLHSNQMPLSKQRAATKPWQLHQAFCRDDPVSMLGVSSSTDSTCRKSPPRP